MKINVDRRIKFTINISKHDIGLMFLQLMLLAYGGLISLLMLTLIICGLDLGMLFFLVVIVVIHASCLEFYRDERLK